MPLSSSSKSTLVLPLPSGLLLPPIQTTSASPYPQGSFWFSFPGFALALFPHWVFILHWFSYPRVFTGSYPKISVRLKSIWQMQFKSSHQFFGIPMTCNAAHRRNLPRKILILFAYCLLCN